jgi:uncharacterized protein YyaL (SSP411 family)
MGMPRHIWELLGSDSDAFVAAYGVTCHDNFEGKNILEFVRELEQLPALAEARRKRYDAREERIQPGRDEKVLKNGRLLRTWKQGEAKLNGYLEDHVCLIEGLMELYQTPFERAGSRRSRS